VDAVINLNSLADDKDWEGRNGRGKLAAQSDRVPVGDRDIVKAGCGGERNCNKECVREAIRGRRDIIFEEILRRDVENGRDESLKLVESDVAQSENSRDLLERRKIIGFRQGDSIVIARSKS